MEKKSNKSKYQNKKNPYQKRKHVVKRKSVKKTSTELSCTESPIKRKRGRPRKDASCPLNDVINNVNEAPAKKRGRPKKVFTNQYKKEEPILNKPMKTLKMAGYCPSCYLTLTTTDIIDGVFTCYKCNKSGNESELSQSTPIIDKPKSKKEYLQTIFPTSLEDNYYDNSRSSDSKTEDNEEVEEVEEDKEINKVIDTTEDVDIDIDDANEIKADEQIIIEKNIKNFIDNNDQE
jgi:hypothetical protein